MKQSEVFLKSEGDEWFKRNEDILKEKDYSDDDFLISELMAMREFFENKKVLEIGCSEGSRLIFIKNKFECEVYGIDPSTRAIAEAKKRGLNVKVGAADRLEFDDNFFDVVIFGFCLYLCDREDLFKIAFEVDRVSKNESWIVIFDFYASMYSRNNYSHYKGILSHKFDNKKLFEWHPAYTCISHKVRSHDDYKKFTDIKDDWIAVSILRKKYE